MGELRTRKRGKTWEWSFEGAKIGGKRKPISKGGYRTKADALAAGTQAKAEYDNTGRAFKPTEMSLSDYMDYWYEHYVLQNLSYSTQQTYEICIRRHIKPLLGAYRLASVEPETVQRWIDRIKAGMAQNTIDCIFACLSGALDYAVYPCKYIKGNPCRYIKRPKVEINMERKKHTDYICRGDDYAAIIARFPPESNFYLPLETAYNCGTRLGETYGFDLLQDVDFDNHTIAINHQLKKENGAWVYRPPKYNSYRTIKMIPAHEEILKREIEKRKENMQRYGAYFRKSYIKPDGSIIQANANITMDYPEIMPICVRENGELLNPNSFQYCADVIHKELKNLLFHSHCLRHTHGTLLAEGGAQPKTVMERLGHKDIKVTMEKYVFNTDMMQDDAVAVFMRAANRSLPTA